MSSEIRFCPNCGSTKVEPDSSRTNMIGGIISKSDQWLCRECEYRGMIPKSAPEKIKENSGEIKFENTSNSEIEASTSRAYFRYFLYVGLPLSLVYLITKLIF
ncbi:hypothetical protein [Candidatus Nanohalobium constans]|uniref:Uncharacterized protein n=1 Tax=Candidatus Nanohalobium constans TaxID=2565781 RepID=A0A5Q0UHE4_9ARCH|nr:hypothetical protein [Candidatus Nanohalobium constans]QGA80781.1 hypothetical protein LC1Nh_0898 [Candidatus Nanohalobium constans]